MYKNLIFPLIVLASILGGAYVLRFVLNGGEDTWICSNNQWVKHGNPKDPAPATGCGDNVVNDLDLESESSLTDSIVDTDEEIVAGVSNAFADKYKRPAASFMLNVEEKDSLHAKGSVRFKDELDGGIWFAAKNHTGWVLVFDGQGILSCESANEYDFSTAMVPGCIDVNNENVFVQR